MEEFKYFEMANEMTQRRFAHAFQYLFVISCFCCHVSFAQKQQSVQVKTFDQQLVPVKNIEISINNREYFPIGSKGVTFIELLETDFPLKSIGIKDEKFETASWNYSKGVLEVIVRPRSYKMVHVTLRDKNNIPLTNKKVTFKGRKISTVSSNAQGVFEIPLALDEKIQSHEQFAIPEYVTQTLSGSGETIVVIAELAKTNIPAEQQIVKEVPRTGYFKDFDLTKLDSIQSLTAFYAIFKNLPIKDLSETAKRRIDAKFNQLVIQLQDSLMRNEGTFMGRISDSSFVNDDIKNLLAQATQESQMLDLQRTEFDEKIQFIENKLATGISTMDEGTRASLLSDLTRLEAILRENESRFYKNQNDYRQIINALKEKYFDITVLENRLSESEKQRLAEQRAFRQKLFITLGILLVFALLVLLLIYFADKLKKQKKELIRVNDEINRINENLESLVSQRTKLLEESNKELDTFLYRASHDLRSPVCSIIGLCNIALSMSNGESKELVERVVFTTSTMDRLLKKLSIISEINQPTNLSSITLLDLVENVRESFSKTIDENKIEFKIDCPADLVFYSYPNLIETILSNLIENACVYSVMRNANDAKVELNASIKDNEVLISVYDNGLGVDDSISHKLFDMFFKGNENSKGHGLGLYIVQKSVQALGGRIDVESVSGAYARFVVRLPMKPIAFGKGADRTIELSQGSSGR